MTTPAATGWFVLFCFGLIGIALILRWLHNHFASVPIYSDPYAGMATCLNCDEPIRGCSHNLGVPSTWVHSKTHRRRCFRGSSTFAEHR